MRQHSEQLEEVLTGSFERELTVNVFNGSDRMLENIALESWQLDGDLSAAIGSSGQGTVVHRSVNGESLSPSGTDGVLSAFRARIEPVMTIRAGDFEESVSLGTYRVVAIPSSQDFMASHDGREVVTGCHVELKFESLDSDIDRWGFQFPEQSEAGASAFEEIRRFTSMPVEMNVPDVALPTAKVWEAKQGGRLEAVAELGKVLGGTAVVNSRGAWEIVPDELGEPVATLRLGDLGTVLDVADEIVTDTVYNEVVGSFEDVNGNPFWSVARVDMGPLSVDGPYGVNTRYYSSDLVETQGQGDRAVRNILNESIGSQQYTVQIQCHVNPLVEIGDVVELVGWKRRLIGWLTSVSLNDSPMMNVSMLVERELL